MSPTAGILGHALLAIAVVASFGLFGLRVYHLYRLARLGQPENRTDDLGQRVRTFVVGVLGQRKLLYVTLPGVMHFTIFWGFLIITLGTTDMLLSGLIPGAHIPLVGTNPFYYLLLDLVAGLVIVALGVALYRRLAMRVPRLHNSGQAYVIIGLIFTLMATIYVLQSFAIVAGGGEEYRFAPISKLLALGFAGVSRGTATLVSDGAWWLHVLVVLGFLIYLPRSKHTHLFIAPLNAFFSPTQPKGALKTIENIEEAESFGVGRVEQFGWKHLLDTYACTECGRCDRGCPALLSGKPLSPRDLVLNLREALFEEGPQLLAGTNGSNGAQERKPLIGENGYIMPETLWACTTCFHCVAACPVFIEHVPKIIDMRRNLVMEESSFPPEVVAVFNNLERNGNPYEISRKSRADWAEGLGVKTLAEDPNVDILYWVGCLASFDQRNKRVAVAMAKILKEAGINFGILGVEESCNGDPARRIGNEYLFQILAQGNVETLNGYGVKKILTTCAHCFNTLKNEYPDFGGNYEVVHHSEYLQQLIAEGRIKMGAELEETVTFHDPCYLGRYNDIYDQPRTVVDSLPGANRVEMERNRRGSFCCGAGGGRAFMEERTGRRINQMRVEQAMDTGASVIAAACPFCMQMFEDGITGKGVEDNLRVIDIAELVEKSIVKKVPSAP